MQSMLTRFEKIDAVFAINDPTGIGASLAAKQANRTNLFITAVDGAPDIEAELKDTSSLVVASSSQDPYAMAPARHADRYRPDQRQEAGAAGNACFPPSW